MWDQGLLVSASRQLAGQGSNLPRAVPLGGGGRLPLLPHQIASGSYEGSVLKPTILAKSVCRWQRLLQSLSPLLTGLKFHPDSEEVSPEMKDLVLAPFQGACDTKCRHNASLVIHQVWGPPPPSPQRPSSYPLARTQCRVPQGKVKTARLSGRAHLRVQTEEATWSPSSGEAYPVL